MTWRLVIERDRALRAAALMRYQNAIYRRALVFSLSFVFVSLILSTTLFALAIVAVVLIRGWKSFQLGVGRGTCGAVSPASRENK